MAELIRYEAARSALAAARSIDEVQSIRNQAAAMAAYAKQAKDMSLIADATEIRLRAERRLGEMMKESALPHGGDRKSRVAEKPLTPTLKEAGIDKNLAHRARVAASLDSPTFEQAVTNAREAVQAAGARPVIILDKTARRARKLQALQVRALPTNPYHVIYADPPWHFEMRSEAGRTRGVADNHYPTMSLDAIKALRIPAARDAVLFLWATVPMWPAALDVMEAWGFEYKSATFWDKEIEGTGYWVRSRVEPLLIGTRGTLPAPVPALPGLFVERRGLHSAKPEAIQDAIGNAYSTLPKLELFARKARPGWENWGAEMPITD